MNYKKEIERLLNADIYSLKEESVPVNGGKAIFSKNNHKMKAGVYEDSKIDELGRSIGAIAILNKIKHCIFAF